MKRLLSACIPALLAAETGKTSGPSEEPGTAACIQAGFATPDGTLTSVGWEIRTMLIDIRERDGHHEPQTIAARRYNVHPSTIGRWSNIMRHLPPATATATLAGPAAAAGTYLIGHLPVARIGYSTTRLADSSRDPCLRLASQLLCSATESGVNHIDMCDSDPLDLTETLVRRSLASCRSKLFFATTTSHPVEPSPARTPDSPKLLVREVHQSLARLHTDAVDLYYLRPSLRFPLEEQLGVLTNMQRAGKIRHIGLMNVSLPTLSQARGAARIAAVRNRSNLIAPDAHVVEECRRRGIAYVATSPIGGRTILTDRQLSSRASDFDASPAQYALAWHLHRGPHVLPVAATGNPAHLNDNAHAAAIRLPLNHLRQLSRRMLNQPSRSAPYPA